MGKPSFYVIRVEGQLDESWSSWFADMAIEVTEGGETVLSGPLTDEAALHGVLMKIRDLSLPLVAVQRRQYPRTSPNHQ